MNRDTNVTSADVNKLDACGFAPLHRAILWNCFECVKFFVDQCGANVHLRDISGRLPLFFAAGSREGHAVCARHKSKSNIDDPTRIVRYLLRHGACVDEKNLSYGRMVDLTALNEAIRYEHVHRTRVLIDHGAKLSNVKLGYHLLRIPQWVEDIVVGREKCRQAAIAIIGIRLFGKTRAPAITRNVKDIFVIIACMTWSTRFAEAWTRQNSFVRRNKFVLRK